MGRIHCPTVPASFTTDRVQLAGISEGLSRMSWKLSRTVLRGEATGNGGFLLGRERRGGKCPFHVSMKDGLPMTFAGLWESWKSPEGQNVETCTILTTAANKFVAPIHDRMPVILHPCEYDTWLDKDQHDPEKLRRLYQPYPADLMTMNQVSPLINNPKNDYPDLLVAAEASDLLLPLGI